MKETALKPCPFCGGEGQVVSFNRMGGPTQYMAQCKAAMTCGCALNYDFDSEKEAVEAWNHRMGGSVSRSEAFRHCPKLQKVDFGSEEEAVEAWNERKTEIINLTPHDIVLYGADGTVLRTIERSGVVARAQQTRQVVGELDGIPICANTYGAIEGLPDPQPGTVYVVSALTAQAAKAAGREDVYIVDDTVRDESGAIIGCRALAKI